VTIEIKKTAKVVEVVFTTGSGDVGTWKS